MPPTHAPSETTSRSTLPGLTRQPQAKTAVTPAPAKCRSSTVPTRCPVGADAAEYVSELRSGFREPRIDDALPRLSGGRARSLSTHHAFSPGPLTGGHFADPETGALFAFCDTFASPRLKPASKRRHDHIALAIVAFWLL